MPDKKTPTGPSRDSASTKTLIDKDRYASIVNLERYAGDSEKKDQTSYENVSIIVCWDGANDPVRDPFTIHKVAFILNNFNY
jgi:hypothetical protein